MAGVMVPCVKKGGALRLVRRRLIPLRAQSQRERFLSPGDRILPDDPMGDSYLRPIFCAGNIAAAKWGKTDTFLHKTEKL